MPRPLQKIAIALDGDIYCSIERALVNRAFRMRTVKQASVLFRIQGGVTRRDSA